MPVTCGWSCGPPQLRPVGSHHPVGTGWVQGWAGMSGEVSVTHNQTSSQGNHGFKGKEGGGWWLHSVGCVENSIIHINK